MARPPAAWTAAIGAVRSTSSPWVPGYWKMAPKQAEGTAPAGPVTTSIPSGVARVRITARVCGCSASSAKNTWLLDFDCRCASAMASAAAVASSSSEAFAISSPVRSATMVW